MLVFEGNRGLNTHIGKGSILMMVASRRLLLAMLFVVTGIPSALAQEPMLLARDGRALATIVAPNDSSVPGAAARELKTYLDRITGGQFAIAASCDTSPRIFVGDCPQAKATGLEVAKLKRDGYFRGVVGGDLYLLGRDAPSPVKLVTGTRVSVQIVLADGQTRVAANFAIP